MNLKLHHYHTNMLNFMAVGTLHNLHLELCVKEFISTV